MARRAAGAAHLFVLGLPAVLLVSFVTGCSGGLGTAEAEYRKGHVAEAKTELLSLEASSRSWSQERRAEYALYRGLVHGSLGDRAAAGVWLAEAKALEDAQPHRLSNDDRTRLRLALESLASDAAPPSP